MTDPVKVLPIVQGDWVVEKGDGLHRQLGRVRYAWFDGDEILMNLVLFNMDGEKVGRESPDMGGPKSFEPCVPFDDERWTRIEEPDFPLERCAIERPSASQPGFVTLDYTYASVDGSDGYKIKASRTKPKKQSGDRPAKGRQMVRFIEIEKPSNGLDLEIAGLRRAAQEMRDTARGLDGAARDAVIARAEALDREAEALAS